MADVSLIYLRDGATGASVSAELMDEIGVAQLDDWRTKWGPVLLDVLRDLATRGVHASKWPQSWHWRWDRRVAETTGIIRFKHFSVNVNGVCQGLMLVDLEASARSPEEKGKAIAYVELVEAAPWNRTDCVPKKQYEGIGSALITAATALSESEGFKGRIGLHSLPQADGFYQHLGMSDLGSDPHYQGLRYFEFTSTEAAKFLAEP